MVGSGTLNRKHNDVKAGTMSDQYVAAQDRYEAMPYRRTGRSGLKLPAISLGLWHNFGDDVPIENQRAVLRRAFDLGITHFDLANNYGPPYGSAETNFGRILREDFSSYREELVISSKAGWDMWPGPYGFGGSRKYLLSSLDQSLGRLGVDYVDIFYSHRPDAETPIDETAGALIRRCPAGQGPVRGYQVRTRRSAPVKSPHCSPLRGCSALDPPAELFDAEPLDRAGPAVGCRRSRRRRHRVLTTRSRHAHRSLSERRPRGFPCSSR